MSDIEQSDESFSELLKETSVSSEQNEFNELSNSAKLRRLNRLLQQTEVYSQIILDNMLEKSLEKKRLQKEAEKLRRRDERRQVKRKYKEEKAKAVEAGEPVPEAPVFSDTDSGSDFEEAEAKKEEEVEIVKPPTPESEAKESKENSDVESDSDLEIVQVNEKKRRKSGRESRHDKLTKRKLKEEKKRAKEEGRKVKKPKKESSKKTRDTRRALESAQTAHNQLQPSAITGCTMKDYQLDGLEWLVTLYENGLNGILADEMGLGKTLQCIALISYLIEHKVKGPFLVVAPLSTVNNWCREFSKFAPSIEVVKYTGVKEERQQIKFSKNLRGKVVVTSYEIIIRDFRRFSRLSWSYLTVDEGHRLKNFECLLIQKLKQLDTANRLLLTGTPLQNNLNELWSLLNFILPDIFADLDLFQSWFNFEAFTGEGDSNEDKIFQADVRQKLIKSLHSILKPFLLRRLKNNVVKDLPPKKEYIVYADLTPVQRALYAASMKGEIRRAITELYAKEILIHKHPELFTAPEHLKVVRDVLYRSEEVIDVDESDDGGRALRKHRAQKYTQRTLRMLENTDALVYASDSDDDFEVSGSDDESAAETSKTEISLSLKGTETLQGEDLKREVERRTEELERKLMMSLPAGGAKLGGQNGALLKFYPQGQDVKQVRLTPQEIGNSVIGEPDVDAKNNFFSNVRDKLQTSLSEVLSNGNSEEQNGSAKSSEKPKRARRKAAKYDDEESDIEVIEIHDNSDLNDDEMRMVYCEEAIEVANKRATNLTLQNKLMQLRKVCGSHYTFYDPFLSEENAGALNETELKEFSRLITLHSGKIQVFKQLLDRLIPEGHKVLVFSQFTTMLDVLEILLADDGIPFARLDGASKQEEREDAMEVFKEDGPESAKVFLLSTRAGGLGLNLVSADTVILFDSDWNPQMDIQAIDRSHRIGQTKPIKIFRLVVRNSVEELLIVKSFNKRLLERMVIASGEFQLGKVAKKLQEEKIDLDSFKTMTAVLDLGNMLDLYGAHEKEYTLAASGKLLLEAKPGTTPLSEEEMDELMDRSRECYNRNPLETRLGNVVAFESSSNNEEEEALKAEDATNKE